MVLQWGHIDLQEYVNGSFVSNNNIFTILFFNTYYDNQISKILTAAFNETCRQSLDPVYAHTQRYRAPYFQPKVKDFARGEVNYKRLL